RTRSMPEFNTIREVLTLFGLKRVQSWTTMLSISSIDEVIPEVFITALSRAIFMRNLAVKESLIDPESFYLAGMFSLLDVIMGQPLETVLQQLPISQFIIDGLIEKQGDYGRVIAVAESYERGQPETDDQDVANIYLQAFQQTQKLFSELS
ncbi:MAG: diguanylate phosphodiesterase, partial [Pseudomonadota bacterium]|nr:diguanylate phosphodiesterase [Pseudomonadota bacterium]